MISLLFLTSVWASPVDIYGFGAPMMGRGMGGVAINGNVADMVNNPSSLHGLSQSEFQFGYHILRSKFSQPKAVRWDTNIDGKIDELDEPYSPDLNYPRADGLSFGLGRPVGKRLGIGIVAFIPTDRLLRVHTFEPSLPRFFMYDNRPNTYFMSLGFGWQQLPGVTVGGAVELSAKARYQISATLSGTVTEPSSDSESIQEVTNVTLDIHEMTLELAPDYAPVASVLIHPGEWNPRLKGLTFGLVYRGSTGLPVDVEVDLQMDVGVEEFGELGDMGFAALAPFQMAFFDHYVPSRLSLGAAYKVQKTLLVYTDLRWTQWSKMSLNIAQVTGGQVEAPLIAPEGIPIEDSNAYYLKTKDTWDLRMGMELKLPLIPISESFGSLQPHFRGGYARTPSVLEELGSNVSLMDTSRATYTVGFGVDHGSPFGWLEGPISWDSYFQLHYFIPSTLTVSYSDQYQPGAPINGDKINMNGNLKAAGIQARIQY